ncbi:MAG: hypothetical protein RL385_35 [Pseudomonadota bacterium]
MSAAAHAPSAASAPLPTTERPRTGSLSNPYTRADGKTMANVTLTLPTELAQRWREFCARLPPRSRGEWTAEWLEYAMSFDGQWPPNE